ncbi:MAG: uroporphyrinogen decarboxylase family protein [Bacteroidota bacterium]
MNNRLPDALDCRNPGRVPFIPAIYEHKAWFVGETPSAICRDAGLFTSAVLAEFELVRPDALVIGIDVYNIEAEACGSEVTYFDGEDTSIPAIGTEGAVLKEQAPVSSLKIPDPKISGRMPLNLEVARRVMKELGREVPIRGAISGPFSLAANLLGAENLFLMTLTNPKRVHEILEYAVQVAGEFGRAFCEVGCGVIIFDSQSSPDILSPAMYKEFILGPTKQLIASFHDLGIRHIPLIIGGNTTTIVELYAETGANNILCDSTADRDVFLSECSKRKIAFRRNISSRDFLIVQPDELRRQALQYIHASHGYPGFIMGTGVVPYGTPVAALAAIRSAVEEVAADASAKP